MKKKLISLILALAMILSCAAASAGTVYTRINVDQEAAKKVITGFGVPEEKLTVMDTVFALINALGVKVTTLADGIQLDLDLNGENVLSLGFAQDEKSLRLVSTIIPNFVLSLKQETVSGIMEILNFFRPVESGSEKVQALQLEDILSKLPAQMQAYTTRFFQACTKAAVPGEPVRGEYQFDGVGFDTLTSVTVDVPAIKNALDTVFDEMLKDESVVSGMKKGFAMSGDSFDPEKIRKGVAEFEAHFPDTVTAEVYSSSDGSAPSFIISKAFYAGKEDPSFACTILMKDEKSGAIVYNGYEQEMVIGLIFGQDAVRVEVKKGEKQFILDLAKYPGDPAITTVRLYFMDTDHPFLTVQVASSENGERTLPAEAGDKAVMAVEDLLSGRDETGGLLADLMINGLGTLMTKLNEQVPAAAGVINALITGRTITEAEKIPEEKAPEKEEPKDEADPSAWKTLGDVRSLPSGSKEASWDNETYVYIFDYAGTQWLVQAAFSKELSEAVAAVDWGAENRDEQINAILAPCEILKVIDIGTLALPQEELDQWIGKTGRDLLDAGWEYNGYSSDETGIHVSLVNGDFQYSVSFAEELITGQVFGEQPENLPTAIVTALTFESKSYNFSEDDYLQP